MNTEQNELDSDSTNSLVYGETVFPNQEEMSTAILYDWVTAGGQNSQKLARHYVQAGNMVEQIQRWMDARTANAVRENWDHAKAAVIEILDREIAELGPA